MSHTWKSGSDVLHNRGLQADSLRSRLKPQLLEPPEGFGTGVWVVWGREPRPVPDVPVLGGKWQFDSG